jgi:hypothetical protein
MTFAANTALTAAQLNTFVRDNLNETAAARATATSQWFVSTAANSIAARTITGAIDTLGVSFTTTSYTETSTNASVTLTTGPQAIVGVFAQLDRNTTGTIVSVNFAVTGATSISPQELSEGTSGVTAIGGPERLGTITWVDLNPGSNTFSMKYKIDSGTGIVSKSALLVMAV